MLANIMHYMLCTTECVHHRVCTLHHRVCTLHHRVCTLCTTECVPDLEPKPNLAILSSPRLQVQCSTMTMTMTQLPVFTCALCTVHRALYITGHKSVTLRPSHTVHTMPMAKLQIEHTQAQHAV